MKREFISAEKAHKKHGIDLEHLQVYLVLRELPDGTLCGIVRLLYHYSIHVGIEYSTYKRRWCFGQTLSEPILALLAYDGGDYMPGPWRKDVQRGICRDPVTGITWKDGARKPKEVSADWAA